MKTAHTRLLPFVVFFTLSYATHTTNSELHNKVSVQILLDNAQSHFEASYGADNIEVRKKMLQNAQCTLSKAEYLHPTVEQLSDIYYREGLIWLSLAETVPEGEKQSACMEAARWRFKLSDTPLAHHALRSIYPINTSYIQEHPEQVGNTKHIAALLEIGMQALSHKDITPNTKLNSDIYLDKEAIPAMRWLAISLQEKERDALDTAQDLFDTCEKKLNSVNPAQTTRNTLIQEQHKKAKTKLTAITARHIKNLKAAEAHLQIAATQHHDVDAQRLLAELYINNGRFLKNDYMTLAHRWYSTAADGGCVVSRSNLIIMNYNLHNKVKDYHHDLNTLNSLIPQLDSLITQQLTLKEQSSKQAYLSIRKQLCKIRSHCSKQIKEEEDTLAHKSKHFIQFAFTAIDKAQKNKKNPTLNDYATAIGFKEQITKLYEKTPYSIPADISFCLAVIEADIGRTEKAYEHLMYTIEKDNTFDNAYVQLGEYHLSKRQFSDAKHNFTKAKELKNSSGYSGLGFMQFMGYGFNPDMTTCQQNFATAIDLIEKEKSQKDASISGSNPNKGDSDLFCDLKRAKQLLLAAKLSDPTYVKTMNAKQLSIDIETLVTLSPQQYDGAACLALGRLAENILSLPEKEQRLLFHVINPVETSKDTLLSSHDDTTISEKICFIANGWYQKALDQNCIEGAYRLSNVYLNYAISLQENKGSVIRSTKIILEQLIETSKKVADNYYLYAAYTLYGQCLEEEGDRKEAYTWYQQAADFDMVIPDACLKMASWYSDQDNPKYNPEKATFYRNKASSL